MYPVCTQLMPNLDEIERAIQAVLQSIPASESTSGDNLYRRAAWTRAIKEKLRALAQKFKCHAVEGEWLYDLCWYEMTKGEAGYLLRVPLVMECEWTPDSDMDGDFQKLVQARAEHRLWIFQAATADDIERYFDRCREQVATFRGSERADRYLMAGVDRARREFRFAHHVVP
jgi:hypothetical protein